MRSQRTTMQMRSSLAGPMVRGLSLGKAALGSLNPSDLPIAVIPGDNIVITEYSFEYKGPSRVLWVGWAIKPAGAMNFPQGLVQSRFNSIQITAPNSASWTKLNVANIQAAPCTIPVPGTYNDIFGIARTFNEGNFDSWIYVLDYTRASADGKTPVEDAKYAIRVDTDASVGKITWGLAVQNLGIRYAKMQG